MKNWLERIMFQSRWSLITMAFGLLAALGLYIAKFSVESWELLRHGLHMGSEEIMVSLLGLVDMFMVANLLVMITQGSYQIFVKRFTDIQEKDRPQWLDHVDSAVLKVKIATSIVGITLIRILKDFVNIENVSWDVLVHRMVIHGLCLLSSLSLAVIWKLLHPNAGGHHG